MLSVAVRPHIDYPTTTYVGGRSDLKNEIPYMDKNDDIIADASDLPDGVHAVFMNKSIGRGVSGQFTHSAISIILFGQVKGLSEATISALIAHKAVGCLYIKDHKIQSLTLVPESVQKNLQFFPEIMIRVGSQLKAIDHTVQLRETKSEEQYIQFCSKIIPGMKARGLVS